MLIILSFIYRATWASQTQISRRTNRFKNMSTCSVNLTQISLFFRKRESHDTPKPIFFSNFDLIIKRRISLYTLRVWAQGPFSSVI